MTTEEMQKTMQFILEQQAQFVANQQRADERIERLETVVTRFANASLARFEKTDERINALIDSQVRTEDNLKKTGEDLRNLIAGVDRYFSQGQRSES